MKVQEAIGEIMAENPKISRDQAFVYAKKVNRELYDLYVLAIREDTVSLTAGTYKYAVLADVRRIISVNYVYNANDRGQGLVATSTFDLDVENPEWRNDYKSTPQSFAFHEGNIIIYPKPDKTSLGSPAYPRLEVVQAIYVELTEDGDLPRDIPLDVYIEGIKHHWARNKCKEDIQLTFQLYEAQKQRLQILYPKLSHHYRPQVTPDFDYARPI